MTVSIYGKCAAVQVGNGNKMIVDDFPVDIERKEITLQIPDELYKRFRKACRKSGLSPKQAIFNFVVSSADSVKK